MNITKGRLVQISFQKLGMSGSDTTTSGDNDQLALLELELMITSRPELGVEWHSTEDANSQVQPGESSGVTVAQIGPVTDMLAYNLSLIFALEESIFIWKRRYDTALLNLTTRVKEKNTPTRINAGAFYDLSKQVYKNTQGIQYNLNSINILDGLVNSNAASIQVLTSQMGVLAGTVSTLSSTVNSMSTDVIDNKVRSEMNEVKVDSLNVPGIIATFPFDSTPHGWLECNGDLIQRTSHPDLFNAIGTTYGAGDGTSTFQLPDLRGEFVRGWDNDRGLDPNREFGSNQNGTAQITDPTLNPPNVVGLGNSGAKSDTNVHVGADPFDASLYPEIGRCSIDATGSSADVNSGGWEGSTGVTRPMNVAMLYCIKY